MKIVLDATAIDRLLGDNEEAKVEITKHAIEQFAKQRLKPVVNSSAIRSAIDAMEKYNHDAVKTVLCVDRWGTVTLPEPMKREVREAAKRAVDEAFQGAITEASKELLAAGGWTDSAIKLAVEKRLNRMRDEKIAEHIDSEVKARLAKIVTALT